MKAPLRLTIATPSALPIDCADVTAFRADDLTGSFGILPGHADFLTVLAPCVLRWRTTDSRLHWCAVSGGVLRVVDGQSIRIACRDAELGDALETLEAQVRAARETRVDSARRARVEQTRLNAHAIRQILRYLRPGAAQAVAGTDGAHEGLGNGR